MSGGCAYGTKTSTIDLRQDPRVLMRDPAHTVHFYMPISTMKAYAEQNDMPAVGELPHSPTSEHNEPLMRRLGEAALAAFANPHKTGGLLVDTILDAVCTHVLGQYGVSKSTARTRSYGLAPWQ